MTANPQLQRRAAGDLARAFQLVEIECSIYRGGCTDRAALDFINGLTPEQDAGVRAALRKLLVYLAASGQSTLLTATTREDTSTRELGVAVAMATNFDRRQALAAATLSAERM